MSIKIAPVGTCRIHNPLKKGIGRHPITLVQGRNYGFVHTSAEVVQQLMFMLGLKDVPEHIRPVVFRPGLADRSMARPHTPADIYVIEISSRKELSVDGCSIQLNYMGRHFVDFFSDKGRTRMFWSMASDDQLARRRELLDRDPAFLKLKDEDKHLLASIVKRDMSDADIERNVDEMVELVGKDRLVLVTHVNALKPDNTPIESRSGLIATVRAIAERKGIPFYDPTPLMNEFGQVHAMENDGLDLTHYTEAFYGPLCDALLGNCMAVVGSSLVIPDRHARQVDAPADSVIAIEAAWQSGDIAQASKQLHDLLRNQPASHEHRLLLGRLQCELGDYEAAIRNLEVARAGLEQEDPDLSLMRAYFATGNYREARSMACALVSDEMETTEVFRVAAISANQLHDAQSAQADWRQVYRLAEDKAEAADAVLALLRASGDRSATAAWATEVINALPPHETCLAELWHIAVEEADRKQLLALGQRGADLSLERSVSLAKLASEHGFATPSALLVAPHRVAISHVPEMQAWMHGLTDGWLVDGGVALGQERMLDAADRIQACVQLAPENVRVNRARRLLESKMRRKVRGAFASKDFAEAIELGRIADVTLLDSPDIDSYVGRSLFEMGDYANAFARLRGAADVAGASVLAKVLCARAALRSNHYAEAVDTYREVTQDQGAEEWARTEAENQLKAMKGRLIRVARDLAGDGQHEKAWQLLDRLEAIGSEAGRVDRERKRVLAMLHARLKSLDPLDDDQRLALGEVILRLAPGDLTGLKAVALGSMRSQQFARALHCWTLIKDSGGANEQVDNNIRKCLLWIDRLEKRRGARKAA